MNCQQRLGNRKCMYENIAISTFYKDFKMRGSTETALITFFIVFISMSSKEPHRSLAVLVFVAQVAASNFSADRVEHFVKHDLCLILMCKVASVSGLLFTAENCSS